MELRRTGVLLAALALTLTGCRGGGDVEAGEIDAPGVTSEPCPDAVNEDNGCIYLGTISDLTQGPFAPLGVPITEAQKAFWQRVNEDGGIGGYDIDVTGKVDYADYVVVMSAGSDRQANAIAKNVDSEMSKRGIKPSSIEGLPQGAWVLMDFGDVVVHIFHQDTRGYYDLESLWFDAARVEVKDKPRA